jgi:hypothetical protein
MQLHDPRTLDFPTPTAFAVCLAVSEVFSPKAIILARLRGVMCMMYLIKMFPMKTVNYLITSSAYEILIPTKMEV